MENFNLTLNYEHRHEKGEGKSMSWRKTAVYLQ